MIALCHYVFLLNHMKCGNLQITADRLLKFCAHFVSPSTVHLATDCLRHTLCANDPPSTDKSKNVHLGKGKMPHLEHNTAYNTQNGTRQSTLNLDQQDDQQQDGRRDEGL